MNAYKALKKENDLRSEYLTEQSGADLNKLIKYLNTCSCKPYEVQLVRKDLIGATLEAEQSGKSFSDVIGDDKSQLANDLRSSIGHGNPLEFLMTEGVFFFLFLMGWEIMILAGRGLFTSISLALSDAFYPVCLFLTIYYIAPTIGSLFPIPYTDENYHKGFAPGSIILVVLLVVLLNLNYGWASVSLGMFPAIIIPGTYGIIALVLLVFRKRYFDQLAMKKPWSD